jgi:hypothetical protein
MVAFTPQYNEKVGERRENIHQRGFHQWFIVNKQGHIV